MNFWVDSMRIFGGLERNTSAVGRRLRFNLVILIVRILKKINENRNSQTSESCISMMRGRIDLKLVLKCRLDVVLKIPTFLGQSDKSPQNGARSTSSFPIFSQHIFIPHLDVLDHKVIFRSRTRSDKVDFTYVFLW